MKKNKWNRWLCLNERVILPDLFITLSFVRIMNEVSARSQIEGRQIIFIRHYISSQDLFY